MSSEQSKSGSWISNIFSSAQSSAQSLASVQAELAGYRDLFDAVTSSQATIEFDATGNIQTANENFLGAMGYTLDEIQGQHHRMFVDSDYAASAEYKVFWAALGRGQFQAGEFQRFSKSGAEVWIQATYTPVLDNEGKVNKVVKFATDITALRQERMRQILVNQAALDSTSTNVMIADKDFNITYLNKSANDHFSGVQAEIREALPSFDVGTLIGTNMDVFHKSPNHQRSMVAALSDTFKTEISIGARLYGLVANPILDEKGELLGTVVEWTDRTAEVAIERELSDVVTSANHGDLSKRIEQEPATSFAKNLKEGLNGTMDRVEQVVSDMHSVLQAFAKGDLTPRIDTDYEGTFDELKIATNATANELTSVVGNIKGSSEILTTSARELSSSSLNLSQRTEEQASNLQETAASMEEMTSTVSQNADNANQANQLALNTREQAERGGEVVSRAVDAMTAISESSRQIADIIGVIDEIAFQTNLLALNASVEAARAGEQGRGFAVVASEVRNLASRSASAAKEIKELIQDSGGKVEEGSRLVNESGETLEEIVNSVKKVTDIVAEITAASHEQRAGIEQVNRSVSQMDGMTQQNAAMVEEASAASELINKQATKMHELVEFFRTDSSAVTSVAFEAEEPVMQPQAQSQAQAQAQAQASEPEFVERRSAARPWTAPLETPAAESSPTAEPAQKVAVSGSGDDQDWDEF